MITASLEPRNKRRTPENITMRLRSLIARLFSIAGLFAGVLIGYVFGLRPVLLRWGATPEETARAMPGDGLVANPTFCATRAVTIRGRPEDIWPWIAQMGYDRAGFYGYDLIENLGSIRGIRSAEQIVPELQHPAVGDRVYMSRIAYLSFDAVVPNRYLIWRGSDRPADSAFTWAIYPMDANHARLVSRIRIRYHWRDRRILLDLFTEFADPVAVPKILEGIKASTEGQEPAPLQTQAVQIAVWVLAVLESFVAVVFVFRWDAWWKAWALAVVSIGVLLFALYARQAVWMAAGLVLVLGAALWIAPRDVGHRPAKAASAATELN
jgi:hypothetical protein